MMPSSGCQSRTARTAPIELLRVEDGVATAVDVAGCRLLPRQPLVHRQFDLVCVGAIDVPCRLCEASALRQAEQLLAFPVPLPGANLPEAAAGGSEVVKPQWDPRDGIHEAALLE